MASEEGETRDEGVTGVSLQKRMEAHFRLGIFAVTWPIEKLEEYLGFKLEPVRIGFGRRLHFDSNNSNPFGHYSPGMQRKIWYKDVVGLVECKTDFRRREDNYSGVPVRRKPEQSSYQPEQSDHFHPPW